jgi:hypothetical protein
MDGEEQDEQEREPEIGDGDADLGDGHDAAIHRTPPGRGPDADRDGERRRQQHRHHRKRQRDGDPLQNQRSGGGVIGGAAAEIAGEQAARPAQVAQPDRQIEAELMAQRRQRIRLRIRPQDDEGRIARQDLQHDEDDQ